MSRVKKLREVLADLVPGDPIRVYHEIEEDVALTLGTYVDDRLVEAPWSTRTGAVEYRVVVVDVGDREPNRTIPFVTIVDMSRRSI